MALLGALATAAVPSLIGGAFSAFGAKKRNEAARAAAERSMQFSRESMQNAYQWAVADMRAAGLNPMLAYQQGGAHALGGTSYQPENVGAAGAIGGASAASSAIAARRTHAELKNVAADTKKKDSERNLNAMRSALTLKQEWLVDQQIHSAKAAATAAKIEEELLKTKAGKVLKNIDIIGRSLNPFARTAATVTR